MTQWSVLYTNKKIRFGPKDRHNKLRRFGFKNSKDFALKRESSNK
jgi:hypothetical protein